MTTTAAYYDKGEYLAYLLRLTKSADVMVREQAHAELLKVGPKGYIHGWIYVGAPGVGHDIHHPTLGHGKVVKHTAKQTHIRFGDKEHAFERGAETPDPAEHFVERVGVKPRAPRGAARGVTEAMPEPKPSRAALPEGPTIKPVSQLTRGDRVRYGITTGSVIRPERKYRQDGFRVQDDAGAVRWVPTTSIRHDPLPPKPEPPAAVPRAPKKPRAGVNSASIVSALASAKSEDEAHQVLASLGRSKADHQAVAQSLGVEYAPSDTNAKLRDAIVRHAVTRRLEHEAYLRRAKPVSAPSPRESTAPAVTPPGEPRKPGEVRPGDLAAVEMPRAMWLGTPTDPLVRLGRITSLTRSGRVSAIHFHDEAQPTPVKRLPRGHTVHLVPSEKTNVDAALQLARDRGRRYFADLDEVRTALRPLRTDAPPAPARAAIVKPPAAAPVAVPAPSRVAAPPASKPPKPRTPQHGDIAHWTPPGEEPMRGTVEHQPGKRTYINWEGGRREPYSPRRSAKDPHLRFEAPSEQHDATIIARLRERYAAQPDPVAAADKAVAELRRDKELKLPGPRNVTTLHPERQEDVSLLLDSGAIAAREKATLDNYTERIGWINEELAKPGISDATRVRLEQERNVARQGQRWAEQAHDDAMETHDENRDRWLNPEQYYDPSEWKRILAPQPKPATKPRAPKPTAPSAPPKPTPARQARPARPRAPRTPRPSGESAAESGAKRLARLAESRDPKDNGPKIRAILTSEGGAADLYRTVHSGPSGQRAHLLVGRVRYMPSGNDELQLIRPGGGGEVLGYARIVGPSLDSPVWSITEENPDGSTAWRGYTRSVATALDTLENGEFAASGRHDSTRIGGGKLTRTMPV